MMQFHARIAQERLCIIDNCREIQVMNIADEVKKLHDLHQRGGLTQEEFAAAKAAVLGTTKMDSELAMAAHFDAVQMQNDIDRLEREWQVERENYMLRGKHGGRYVPTRAMSILTGVLMTGFGVFWTFSATSASGAALMSFLGIIPILVGIGFGIYSHSKAVAYEQAYERYERRRERLLLGSLEDLRS